MAKTYESFSEGYTQVVKPFLKKRPHAESVDGKTVRKKDGLARSFDLDF